MNKKYLWIVGVLVFIALIWAICGGEEQPAPPSFQSYWDDGNAEVIAYSLKYSLNNEPHTAKMIALWQAATLSKDKYLEIVPTEDNNNDRLNGVKQVTIKNIVSGMIPYNLMTVNFLSLEPFKQRPAGAAIKTMFSAADWVNVAFDQLQFDEHTIMRTRQSSKSGILAEEFNRPENGITEDELPLLVMGLARQDLAPGAAKTYPYMPSLEAANMRETKLGWQTAEIRRGDGEAKVKVPAGKFKTYHYLVTPNQGPTLEFFVDVNYPHRIVRYEKKEIVDGVAQEIERAEMTGWRRLKYWEKQGPGDEKILEELGLK